MCIRDRAETYRRHRLARARERRGRRLQQLSSRSAEPVSYTHLDVYKRQIVGRSPGADIVIGAGYVSGRHARFQLMGQNLFLSLIHI